MEQSVGLDVSLEETSICVLDQAGAVVFEGDVSSNPEAIAKALRRRAPKASRSAFETGSLSNWLWHELKGRGFPVLCLDARHANGRPRSKASRAGMGALRLPLAPNWST